MQNNNNITTTISDNNNNINNNNNNIDNNNNINKNSTNNINSDNSSTNTNNNNDDNAEAEIQVKPESKPPTIDFGDPDEENLVRTIAAASRSWGFFQVVNHGVPDEVISRLQEAGAEFFRLPQEEKNSYAKPPESHSIEGYGTKLRNCWGEFLFHKIWPQAQIDYRFWPNSPPTYKAANEEYSKHVKIVADKIFRCLSLGLGLEGHVLKDSIGGEKLEYMMKINYYPPGESNGVGNSVTFGVHPHTDLSTITILVPNQVPGLQVTKGDEHWIDVDYIPNALIIHIGDQIEIASNGLYKSVLHRTVVDKEKTRMSWPVFLEPPPDFFVGPIPQLINDTNPPKYDTVMFKDYVHKKLNKPQ